MIIIISLKLHEILIDIIYEAYPESLGNSKYTKFYIDVISKQMKTFHGRYFPRFKKIEIYNLSRPTGHIISTSIHEVAHHCDYCIRHTSAHDIEFYRIMYKLLIKALGMGIITREDILSASDSYDKERLTKYFGDINEWEVIPIDYKKDLITIKVKNCYDIKDTLKLNGYQYSQLEQTWEKIINKSLLNSEKEFLASLIDFKNVAFIEGNKIDIQAVYYISIKASDDYSNHLSSLGYFMNGCNMNNGCWNKKILATNLDSEKNKLIHIKNYIQVKVIGKK